MKVKWLPQSKKQLRDTANYIRKTFGKSAQENLLREVQYVDRQIGLNPNIGMEEPLLCGRDVLYRSLVVNRHNKIVYSVVKDHIEVAAFWDTRREPKKLTERLK